ncbi:MAG: HAD family acid phosphatase [Paraglaciecola sp.]|uniref:HAD family acid phosphatase n=1 Tax=Paraglaciecola sp. TaxID=1920173 RepID=UPI003266A8E5
MNKAGQLITLCFGVTILANCAGNIVPEENKNTWVESQTTADTTPLSLSNSVKWHTTSKEYQFITQGIYLHAEQQLPKVALENETWVVVMDVDETVLDNSQYQVMLDQTNSHYTSETWASWIAAKEATLVPGAANFMKKVYSLGGKVALVTNREKSLDAYTWENVLALIPVTFENTCLMGRTQADKDAINEHTIINDKDLRRQKLIDGTADCFSNHAELPSWQKAHTIVMQVGDNIEDVNKITQENADINALGDRLNKSIFILPNAMYGSW